LNRLCTEWTHQSRYFWWINFSNFILILHPSDCSASQALCHEGQKIYRRTCPAECVIDSCATLCNSDLLFFRLQLTANNCTARQNADTPQHIVPCWIMALTGK
jgi:hypothetical protein